MSIMKLRIFTVILFLIFLILPTARFSYAEAPDASDLIKRSDDLMRGESNKGIYTMRISTPRWERELKLQVYSRGRDKMFIRILSPAKEAGIGTLRIKNEMWNYLPNVEKIIKIPPSMMLQPWMGSDFANEDLVKESSIVNDYTHTLIAEEILDGHVTSKIELIPNPGASVIWGRIYRWVRSSDAVPLKEEYYNEKGRLIKVLDYSDIGQVSDRVIPKVWAMTSRIKEGHSTIIKLMDVEYNAPLDEDLFTLTNLQKIP